MGWGGIPGSWRRRLSRALRPQSQHSSRLCLLVAVCAYLSPSLQVSGCLVDGFLKIGVGGEFTRSFEVVLTRNSHTNLLKL